MNVWYFQHITYVYCNGLRKKIFSALRIKQDSLLSQNLSSPKGYMASVYDKILFRHTAVQLDPLIQISLVISNSSYFELFFNSPQGFM